MARWIITNDQGFEATVAEAKNTLEQNSVEAGQPMKLWKLHSEASVDVDVTVTKVDD
jgi:hypothetical protein